MSSFNPINPNHARTTRGTSNRVRVILVGRTGQDAALRLDSQIELIRAHHALGAIGELGNPIDSDSPVAATVIVGDRAVPEDRARSFVAALRRVDPAVRVLVMSTQHMPMYDGSVPPDVEPDALRRLIHGVLHLPEELAAQAEASAAAAAASSDIGLSPETDEDAVLDALLAGRGQSASSEARDADRASPALKLADDSAETETKPSAIDYASRYSAEALTPPPLPTSGATQPTRSDDDDTEAPRTGARMPSLLDDDDASDRESVAETAAAASTSESDERESAISRIEASHAEPVAADAPADSLANAPRAALDASPVQAILSGLNPVDTAIAALRDRTEIGDLELLRHGEQRDRAGKWVAIAPEGPHVKVIHEGNVLGYLVSASHPHAINRIAPEDLRYLTLWTALGEHEAQLREFAFTDELTGAYNRRFFNRFMASAIEQAKHSRHYLTLLYFDIDDFKLYNDRYGHSAGDEILVSVVALLKSVIRPSDKVCRLGGDEFAVIFYDPSPSRTASEAPLQDARAGGAPQSISEIARRFQKQICAHRFPKLGEMAPGTLTISGGMATFPWDGRNTEELLSRADELLMQSKAQGKNLITLGPGAEQVCEILDQ